MIKSLALDLIADKIATCTKCADLDALRHEYELKTVPGRGNPDASLLICGEAPGEHESHTGLSFVGPAGRLLDRLLASAGIPQESVFITNTVKCRPPLNRDPELQEQINCRPYLDLQIEIIQPKVILALGRIATVNLLTLFDDPRREFKTISSFRGTVHSFNGIPLVAAYHPSYLLRQEKAIPETIKDLKMVLPFLSSAGKR